MPEYRPTPALLREYPECPGCGRDLVGLTNAVFCPGCGKQLQFKITVRQRIGAMWDVLRHGCLRSASSTPRRTGDRAPILIGYGKAMFKLGWRYESSGTKNFSEALRCYRKSARLGNDLAKARLDSSTIKPDRLRARDD